MPIRNPRRFPSPSVQNFPQPPVTPRLYRNIALTFFGLTIVIVVAVIWISSVKAAIRVRVKRDVVKIDSAVEVAKSPDQGQLRGRVVQGVFDNIQEFTVKAQEAAIVDTVTTGRVKIINSYSKAQPLVKTTRLLTPDGKLFRINATVSVPSGQTVEVDAYSDQPGSQFAIASGTKFTIPGLWVDLQKWIYAEAIAPFTGTTKTVKRVSESDILETQKTLESAIVEQAKRTLIAEAGVPADKVSEDCADDRECWEAVYFITPLEKKTNVKAGQEADGFLAQVKVKVVGIFYPRKDMEALVRTKLKERLPEERELIDFDAGQIAFKLDQLDVATERVRITFTVDASSRLTAQSPALSIDTIAGLPVIEAKSKLTSVDGVESVEIKLSPSWARKIPTRKDAVNLMIE